MLRVFVLAALLTSQFVFADSSQEELTPGALTCSLMYQIPTEGGMVKYISPENGHAQIQLVVANFCNAEGCVKKRLGSTFLGSSIGGASIRIVGDRTTIILRDGQGNRSAASINTMGLLPLNDGAAQFSLNAEGVYKDERFSALIFTCGLVI